MQSYINEVFTDVKSVSLVVPFRMSVYEKKGISLYTTSSTLDSEGKTCGIFDLVSVTYKTNKPDKLIEVNEEVYKKVRELHSYRDGLIKSRVIENLDNYVTILVIKGETKLYLPLRVFLHNLTYDKNKNCLLVSNKFSSKLGTELYPQFQLRKVTLYHFLRKVNKSGILTLKYPSRTIL